MSTHYCQILLDFHKLINQQIMNIYFENQYLCIKFINLSSSEVIIVNLFSAFLVSF